MPPSQTPHELFLPSAPERERQRGTSSLLRLCKALERSTTLGVLLDSIQAEIEPIFGYRSAWFALVDPARDVIRVHGMHSAQQSAIDGLAVMAEIPIGQDAMLQEIIEGDHVVVVVDARTDPRTNKDAVAAYGNRTIINTPLFLSARRIGAFGIGTFGDEGPSAPQPWQIEYLGAVAGHVSVAVDRIQFLEAQQQTEGALFQAKERLQVTLNAIVDGVISVERDGRVDYLNPIAERMLGFVVTEAVGRPLAELLHLRDEQGRSAALPEAGTALRVLAPPGGGEPRLVEVSCTAIRNEEGQPHGNVVVLHDVTEQRRLLRRIEHQAWHDELTGLPNRRAFERALAGAVDDARRNGGTHMLVYLDLDEFKVVNDTCGHAAGDELLRQLSRRLSGRLAEQLGPVAAGADGRWLLARLGGDEFGLLLRDEDTRAAALLAESLQDLVNRYRFQWSDQAFRVGVCLGLAVIDRLCSGVDALLQAADGACYMAKDSGRNRIQIYDFNDPELARRYGAMQWVSRIESALAEDRFTLYAQTIAPLQSAGEGLAFEVLLRLRDESGHIAMPAAFMPAVERYHLAARVDEWVVGNTLRWLAARATGEVSHCAINVSGHTVGDPAMLSRIVALLDASGVPPASLCFEMTETAAVAHIAQAEAFIRSVRARGCHVALDDFGSGMASFAYLKQLPVDVLKVDGLFVRQLENEPVNQAMVRAIHDVARVMGLHTVAEFAETAAAIEWLRALGIDHAQGYAIARPRPIDELLGDRP
jgi:diguanylate cyclase (GGDEF)-like protein/PAS domain S-box-containing protein